MINQETIKINLILIPEYKIIPPYIKISIDDKLKFEGICKKTTEFSFTETLNFGKHKLNIIKEHSKPNQLLHIDAVKLDGINIRDIVWHYSYTKLIGNTMKNIGETCLGSDCVWNLNFESPSYKFVIDWMKSDDKLNT